MFGQLHLLQTAKQEKERTERLIHQLEYRRRQLPGGSLVLRDGKYYRAVNNNGKREQIIIPLGFSGQAALINDLKEGRYIKKALPILKKNLKAYNGLLSQMQIYDPQQIKETLPDYYSDLDVRRILLEGDIEPAIWECEEYEKNVGFPENLKYKSEGGLQTRSKAEADIATKLEQSGLRFRYEPILYLGRHRVSPDFEILHPIFRREYYWEHLGQMDNPDYANRNMDKLRLYAEYGYHPGENLIITWETKLYPLNFEHINDRIRTYFS